MRVVMRHLVVVLALTAFGCTSHTSRKPDLRGAGDLAGQRAPGCSGNDTPCATTAPHGPFVHTRVCAQGVRPHKYRPPIRRIYRQLSHGFVETLSIDEDKRDYSVAKLRDQELVWPNEEHAPLKLTRTANGFRARRTLRYGGKAIPSIGSCKTYRPAMPPADTVPLCIQRTPMPAHADVIRETLAPLPGDFRAPVWQGKISDGWYEGECIAVAPEHVAEDGTVRVLYAWSGKLSIRDDVGAAHKFGQIVDGTLTLTIAEGKELTLRPRDGGLRADIRGMSGVLKPYAPKDGISASTF